jgi:hypothetical protein
MEPTGGSSKRFDVTLEADSQRGVLRVQCLGVRFDPDEFRLDLLSLLQE